MTIQFLTDDNKVFYADDVVLKVTDKKGKELVKESLANIARIEIIDQTGYVFDKDGKIVTEVKTSKNEYIQRVHRLSEEVKKNGHNPHIDLDKLKEQHKTKANFKSTSIGCCCLIFIVFVLLLIFMFNQPSEEETYINDVERSMRMLTSDLSEAEDIFSTAMVFDYEWVKDYKEVIEDLQIDINIARDIEVPTKYEKQHQYFSDALDDLQEVLNILTSESQTEQDIADMTGYVESYQKNMTDFNLRFFNIKQENE